MIHALLRFLVSVLLLSMLIACAHQPGADRRSGEIRACKINCQIKARACTRLCRNNCRSCAFFAHQKAAHSYCQFEHEQIVQGGIISRELNSYRDPLQCRKITCDCITDYRACAKTCTMPLRANR